MITIMESSLFLELLIAIDILNELTEVAVAPLFDWIPRFNSIMCTEVEYSQVCAL